MEAVKTPILEGITLEEQEQMRVCFGVREERFRAGETVYDFAEGRKYLGLIARGSAVIQRIDHQGGRTILEHLESGGVFGEMLMFENVAGDSITVIAEEPCRVWFMQDEHMPRRCEKACAHHSRLVENMFHIMTEKAAALSERVEVLSRRSIREKLLRYFLLLTLIFTFLLPQIASAVSLLSWQYCAEFKALTGKFYYHFTLGFVPYFVLGYYLVRKEFSLTAKRVLYALGVLGFVLTVVLTSFASRLQGAATELFYGYDSLNVLFVCVGLFVFAKEHLNFPNLSEKCHRCIRALSRWSFGAYLVHPLFIESFDIFLHFNTLSLNVFFSVPLLTLIIGALSFLVSALLHQIPFVKKYFV